MRPDPLRQSRRILVLAYECSPRRGSESGAGFAVLSGLVGAGSCTVLVGSADYVALESWARAHPELDVTVECVEDTCAGRFLYQLHHYTQFGSYLLWLRRVTPRLRALAESGMYDVAWHATYSPAWLPSPLRHLHGVATVWGPCTGADRVPRALRWSLRWRSRARDLIDNVTTWLCAHSRATRSSVQSVDLMLLALESPRVRRERAGETAVFVQTTLVDVATTRPSERESYLCYTSPLRAQKGPLIAIEAAARDERVRLVVAPPAKGQMRAEAERVLRDHGAESRVTFVDGLDRDQMLDVLARSKGLVHSAVSDAASMALAEALVLGVPVVALDVPGTRAMKDCVEQPEFMTLVDLGPREEVVRELGASMSEVLGAQDVPQQSLLDQAKLRAKLASYVERALEIHNCRGETADRARPPRGTKIVQLMYVLRDRGGEAVASQLSRGFREQGYPKRNIGVYREAPASSTTADFETMYPSRPWFFGNAACVIRLVQLLRRERPATVTCTATLHR